MFRRYALFWIAVFFLMVTACSQNPSSQEVDNQQEKEENSATQQSTQKSNHSENKEEQAFPAPDSNLLMDQMRDVKLYLDNRDWKLNNQYKYAVYNITAEYVSKKNAKEKVIVHFLWNTSPQMYVDVQDQGKDLYDGDVTWNVFNKKNNEMMYEFLLKNDSIGSDQHELVRVMAGKDGAFAIHYVTEEAPMSAENRQKWIDLLMKAEVK